MIVTQLSWKIKIIGSRQLILSVAGVVGLACGVSTPCILAGAKIRRGDKTGPKYKRPHTLRVHGPKTVIQQETVIQQASA